MNIKAIQCPNCGGTLNVENINQSLFYCMYCGAAVHVETNRNKGYDMEHGRLDARAELADGILKKIDKIKNVLMKNSKAEREMKSLPHVIRERKTELNSSLWSGIKDYVFRGFLRGLGVLFLGAFVVTFLYSMLSEPLLIILEILVGFAPIYIPVIGIIIIVKKQIARKNFISNCETQLKRAKKEYEETNDFIAKNAEVDIPPRFRQEDALNYIIRGLKAREFVNLEQAIFRCEEAMARGEILDQYTEF